jgi:hypothetical protein
MPLIQSAMPELPDDDPFRASLEEFHRAIGAALTAWAQVEDNLADLFVFFVSGHTHTAAARAAFYAVINFNTKLAMTDVAAQWAISQHLPRWTTIHNRLNRQAKRRNDIVHFTLVQSTEIRGDGFVKPAIVLTPSLGNLTAHLSGTPARRLTVNDVQQRAATFQQLAKDINEFRQLVACLPQQALPSKPPEQPPLPDVDNTDKE